MSPIWTSQLRKLKNRQLKNKDRFKIKKIKKIISRTWAIGKIFPTEFVGVQADQPAYCCTSVQCDNCLHIGEVSVVVVVPDKVTPLRVHSFKSAETLQKQIE